ncbi:NADPH-dependent FMN reductase [Mucilaginibacter myungsuensis]|uniref:NAD(P)H-dependent oxidoreductase n=1 Tax=Mucilaginibacter myungsuensis TaxID=649104 RepID=A0A929KUL4_9SPHI|nr:NAD(P)H-dependent oxidoreductase [Mucilaginibacter myungsuensis]MBE9661871.1 NAD(P)H-dependent oxidoreductase [Mucilaginibacter myungsuensis]MDN3599695.1 NAD(P)H-dependent oxidoreductase [Mucilaginibacter myungsuensis]
MVTIIAGTNRPNSNTLKLAKYYQDKLKDKGMDAQLLSLTDLPADLMSTDLYGKRSDAFKPILDQVNESDKFLFMIPEYNGSFPGVLKLFIDACDFPHSFYDKKAALVGLSSGKYGNIRGVEHFNGVCGYLHMHVMPLRIHIANIRQELDTEAKLHLPDTIKFTDEQIEKFIRF